MGEGTGKRRETCVKVPAEHVVSCDTVSMADFILESYAISRSVINIWGYITKEVTKSHSTLSKHINLIERI